jgi:ribose/xylose/arabinose/galactoside ABC-type transport system permease subunit
MKLPEWLSGQTGLMAGSRRNVGLLLALVLILLLLAIFSPQFMNFDLVVVALQVAFVGIASLGTAYLIITGNIDLSIGSMYAVCAVAAAMLAKSVPATVAIGAGIALGGILGWINGIMVWRISISPIIITLGTLTLLRGVALRITNGFGIRGVPASFGWLGQARPFGVPTPVWALLLLAIVSHVVLQTTTIGRHLMAFGGNRQACEAAGVKGRRLVLTTFAINGLLVGTSAVLAASRFGSAAPTFGMGFELDVIAPVILGGVAFTGGEGNIPGVLLAVVLLGVINSGLISLGIDPHYTQIVKGAALIIAVTLDQITHEQQERHRKKLAMQERG